MNLSPRISFYDCSIPRIESDPWYPSIHIQSHKHLRSGRLNRNQSWKITESGRGQCTINTGNSTRNYKQSLTISIPVYKPCVLGVVSLTAWSSGNLKFIDIPASLVVLFLSSTEVTERFKVIGFNIVHSISQISLGIKAGKNPIV
jgi:hypothetical protein